MTIRDILNGVGWIVAACWSGFTLDLIARADIVTSAQWRYLMSVPGGHWSWVGVFCAGALLLIYGLAADRNPLRAIGYAILGFGCGAIAAFYIAAPFVDTGLTTLGYWPWLFGGATLIFLAVLYAKPRPWL